MVTPDRSSRSSTAKKTGNVRWVNSSPGAPVKPGVAWAMPCLISSREMTGQPSAAASSCASVVLPEPGGPLTTISVGVTE